ncbi:endonuclease/exonuclease/phosphatase family protein [Streptomyces albireticuli]|uniref:Endonuclease/exonuclease/phosphatase n=1 Tax=Streptomyces albireticuli TaxID=1940 RepID=A0A2A2D5X0_9ACTN|nr:endonuclease/exonuclease/phosphatase family protein [Streptomyces albireticuli]MCD9145981.1 endonuclease/exonuclease/phosphatase family protein [Streptomyces albireticuli]MCD9165776.1 endonuclease/exonuclease/phosphatase family protein [Streptomyces albireticuli]MCD9195994.1 endonuclease/exonuclease/phosphatase family protein [Streptomyces albireticuli]PAU46911.1 endonuclease/exonuclease/phosphatase [Streptomyces albireticuli]
MSRPTQVVVALPTARPRPLTGCRDEDEGNPPAVADATGLPATDAGTAPDHHMAITAAADRQATADHARLVTYNTLTGGIDADSRERRRLGQLDFLASLDADVIALQELRRWEEGGWDRLWQAANALGMVPLPPVLSRRGRGNHLALLYRPTTVRVGDYDADLVQGAFYHGAGRARLSIKDQPLLTVLITHLSYLGGAERYAEAQWLTGYGDTYESNPQRVVLAGDLNTIGAHDREPDWNLIPANLQSRHRHITPEGTFGDTDRRAIQLLAAAGFRDPFDVLGQAPPRTAGYWSEAERVDHRSDFILVNRHVTGDIAAASVHDTEATRSLSDHVPVVVDLAPPVP